jgi:hypothetical protein
MSKSNEKFSPLSIVHMSDRYQISIWNEFRSSVRGVATSLGDLARRFVISVNWFISKKLNEERLYRLLKQ